MGPAVQSCAFAEMRKHVHRSYCGVPGLTLVGGILGISLTWLLMERYRPYRIFIMPKSKYEFLGINVKKWQYCQCLQKSIALLLDFLVGLKQRHVNDAHADPKSVKLGCIA